MDGLNAVLLLLIIFLMSYLVTLAVRVVEHMELCTAYLEACP